MRLKDSYAHCKGWCSACNMDGIPVAHKREYNGYQSSIGMRPIMDENPLDVDIPVTDSNELQLTEF